MKQTTTNNTLYALSSLLDILENQVIANVGEYANDDNHDDDEPDLSWLSDEPAVKCSDYLNGPDLSWLDSLL